jgi:hypothetical protein
MAGEAVLAMSKTIMSEYAVIRPELQIRFGECIGDNALIEPSAGPLESRFQDRRGKLVPI